MYINIETVLYTLISAPFTKTRPSFFWGEMKMIHKKSTPSGGFIIIAPQLLSCLVHYFSFSSPLLLAQLTVLRIAPLIVSMTLFVARATGTNCLVISKSAEMVFTVNALLDGQVSGMFP
jgi:hypothetical protein